MDEQEPTQGYKSPRGYVAAPGNVSPIQGQVPLVAHRRIHWYHELFIVTVSLVVFFPLGLFLLWTNPTISKGSKITVTAFIVVLLCFIVIPLYNDLAPMYRAPSVSTYTGASPSASIGNAASVNAPASGNAPAGSAAESNGPSPTATTSDKVSQGHNTKLAKLARESQTSSEIEAALKENDWAFYPPGTTDCYDPNNY